MGDKMTNELIVKTIDLHYLEDIIDYAWQQAIKYRYDPVASKIHEDYLEILKKIKTSTDATK